FFAKSALNHPHTAAAKGLPQYTWKWEAHLPPAHTKAIPFSGQIIIVHNQDTPPEFDNEVLETNIGRLRQKVTVEMAKRKKGKQCAVQSLDESIDGNDESGSEQEDAEEQDTPRQPGSQPQREPPALGAADYRSWSAKDIAPSYATQSTAQSSQGAVLISLVRKKWWS
ncbi:hypothetical protein AC579_7670, partial [Pseudocercospora musae]